jgi:hypothetical protein
MKNILLGFLLVGLFSCSKTAPTLVTVQPTQPVIINVDLPKLNYYGKTSYELKVPQKGFINIDSLRSVLGVRYIGRWNGNNNLGYTYIDINNDGREDIFYPIASNDANTPVKPEVFINTGNGYILDNSMLPDNYLGAIDTRKTIVGDFNNDSLPDLFLSNTGFDGSPNINNVTPVFLLSQKGKIKYKLFIVPELKNIGGFHSVSSGDLNGDGFIDLILIGQGLPKILYNNGDETFKYTTFNITNYSGYFTSEIIDVDKDGKNDIILTGDEGRPAPALYSPSTIFFNKNNNFQTQTQICLPNSNGWGLVTDIACADIDGDGVNEIFLSRTQDVTAVWYGGYNLTIYKTIDNYKSFINTNLINNNIVITPVIGNWISHLFLYKTQNNEFAIRADISGCYAYTDYRANPYIKIWKQNQTTKLFE